MTKKQAESFTMKMVNLYGKKYRAKYLNTASAFPRLWRETERKVKVTAIETIFEMMKGYRRIDK